MSEYTDTCRTVADVLAENAKLREALADLWPRAEFTMAPANRASWAERLRALGVEVDE